MSSASVPSADVPPAHLAPTARLSPRILSLLLLAVCLAPLIGLSVYAIWFGRASDADLNVEVTVGRERVAAADGRGAVMADAVVVRNLTDHELPNLTVDLNGQYFLYRHSPMAPGERLVFPQQIFATKSNQRWSPGRYPLTKVTVTARLPSGRRGVKTVEFEAPSRSVRRTRVLQLEADPIVQASAALHRAVVRGDHSQESPHSFPSSTSCSMSVRSDRM